MPSAPDTAAVYIHLVPPTGLELSISFVGCFKFADRLCCETRSIFLFFTYRPACKEVLAFYRPALASFLKDAKTASPSDRG